MNKWEEDLRSKLASYKPEPPVGMWKKLEGRLSAQVDTKASPAPERKRTKRTRRLLFVLSPIAAAACLILALQPLRQSHAPGSQSDPHFALEGRTNPSRHQSLSSKTDAEGIATHEDRTLAQAAYSMKKEVAPATNEEMSKVEGLASIDNKGENPSQAVAAFRMRNGAATKGDSISTATASDNSDGAVVYVAKASSNRSQAVPTPHSGKDRGGMSFALSLQGSPTADNFTAGSYVGLLSASPVMGSPQAGKGEAGIEVGKPGDGKPAPDEGGVAKPGDAYTSVLLNNLRNEVATETHHRLPLTFAVTVAYPLAKGFSLDASLVYTHASSDFRSGSPTDYYFTKQKLDYFGPALHIGWNFLHTRPVTAYLRAGMTLQGCVSGNQRTNYVVSDRPVTDEVEVGVGKGLWQASADAAVGVQLNLIPSLGIYVEPGVSRYIDDRSSLSTYAHDHPTAFSLKAGLRFTLPKK